MLFRSTPVGTVPEWGQCGGINYNGPTVCVAPYTCHVLNDCKSSLLLFLTTRADHTLSRLLPVLLSARCSKRVGWSLIDWFSVTNVHYSCFECTMTQLATRASCSVFLPLFVVANVILHCSASASLRAQVLEPSSASSRFISVT